MKCCNKSSPYYNFFRWRGCSLSQVTMGGLYHQSCKNRCLNGFLFLHADNNIYNHDSNVSIYILEGMLFSWLEHTCKSVIPGRSCNIAECDYTFYSFFQACPCGIEIYPFGFQRHLLCIFVAGTQENRRTRNNAGETNSNRPNTLFWMLVLFTLQHYFYIHSTWLKWN